jgi:nitrite reductase (NO-forming)
MPKATLTDEEVAAAFTFVLNNFGNKGGEVNAADVKAVRK